MELAQVGTVKSVGFADLSLFRESRSTVAEVTLVRACTACANRSRGSRVGVWLEGAGESGSGILGGPGDGRLLLPPPPPLLNQPTSVHIIRDRDSVCEAVLRGIQSGGVRRTWSCSRH